MKNLERLNNIVQEILRRSIHIIRTLPDWVEKKQWKSLESQFKGTEDKTAATPAQKDGKSSAEEQSGEESVTGECADSQKRDVRVTDGDDDEEDTFTYEEKHRLIEFTHKVFLTSFPLYCAQKTLNPSSVDVRILSFLDM